MASTAALPQWGEEKPTKIHHQKGGNTKAPWCRLLHPAGTVMARQIQGLLRGAQAKIVCNVGNDWAEELSVEAADRLFRCAGWLLGAETHTQGTHVDSRLDGRSRAHEQ